MKGLYKWLIGIFSLIGKWISTFISQVLGLVDTLISATKSQFMDVRKLVCTVFIVILLVDLVKEGKFGIVNYISITTLSFLSGLANEIKNGGFSLLIFFFLIFVLLHKEK